METDRAISRKAFAAAALFEGSLIGVALLFASLSDTPLLSQLSWQPAPLLMGVAATVPTLGLLVLSMRATWRPLARIREVVEGSLAPLFRHCSWDELLALALLAGVGEELLFRGVLQTWATGKLGPISALILASIVFGLAHSITRAYAVLATGMGLYLGALLLWTDELIVPIVVHTLYDFIALMLVVRRARSADEDG